MEELHRCVLRNCRMTLLKDMHKVSDILDYLVNHGVFTHSMQADIMAERTERDKVRKMLDDLTRRGPTVWPKFIAGLQHKDVGFGHLAEILEEEENRLRGTPPRVPYPLLTVGPVGPKQGDVGLPTLPATQRGLPIQQPNDRTTVKHPAPQIPYPIAETGQQLSITQSGESMSMDTDEDSPPLLQTAYQRCNPDERYRMESDPRGYMLIINNIEFTKAPRRDGAIKDQQDLVELFVHKLGFKVEIRKNLTAQEMFETLEDFSKLDIHEEADACVVAILTHGAANGTLHGVDMEAVSVSTISGFFTWSNCESLRGKPKLFLIQACRGTGGNGAEQASGNSYQRDHAVAVDADPATASRTPDQADMLFAFSTTEGSVACRHPDEGSWFIQYFVKVFRDRSDNTSVTDLLIRVNNEVHRHHYHLRNSKLMQIPAPVVILTKTWYLNPPSACS